MAAAKGKAAVVVVAFAVVLFVGGGIALAATKPRARVIPRPGLPPPSLADDLRIIGQAAFRYGGKAVASIGGVANRNVNQPIAKGLSTAYRYGKRFLGFGPAPKLSPEMLATVRAMQAQREEIRRSQPLIGGVATGRPPSAIVGATGGIRGLA